MAIERYSQRKNAVLASRNNAKQRDAYIRNTVGSTGSETMSVGPTSKAIEEMEAHDPKAKNRFGFVHFEKLMRS
jgi:hypothetical protein